MLVLRVLLLVAVSGLVLWPAFYNGQPFFFVDTPTYVRGADAAIQKIAGISTSWSQPETDGLGSIDGPSDGGASGKNESEQFPSLSSMNDKAVLAGRSIYYGALLYVGHVAGGFWLSIGVQAILLVGALALTLRACDLALWPHLGSSLAVVCVTPAALFSSYLMPDIFAGLGILTCAVLLVSGQYLGNAMKLFLFVLLTMSLLFHTTHLLVAIAMLSFGLLSYLFRSFKENALGMYIIAWSSVLALIGSMAFDYGVTRLVGAPPIRLPFLMARTIADGPGYRYMLATCPQNGFVVCKFMDRLPLQEGAFLWVRDPANGVFASTDPTTRRALSDEQFRFVLSVLAYEPWSQALASLQNTVTQLGKIGVSEFEYAGQLDQLREKLPEAYWNRMQQSAAAQGRMPIKYLSLMSGISVIFGFICIAIGIVNRRFVLRDNLVAVRITRFVILGVITNAAVCGAMSTPDDRYQARVMWLIPVMALIAYLEQKRRGTAEGAAAA